MSLAEWRIGKGLSQGKLARQVGCSQSSLARWESGEKRPSIKNRDALDVLGYFETNWGLDG